MIFRFGNVIGTSVFKLAGLGLSRVLPPCCAFHSCICSLAKNSKYLLLKLVIPSPHDSGGSLWSSEQMDLQVDYWLVGGNKRDINKVQSLQAIMKKAQDSYLLIRRTCS